MAEIERLLAGDFRTVSKDENRRLLDRTDMVREHFETRGVPVGHGFTQENVAENTAYYGFDAGPVNGEAGKALRADAAKRARMEGRGD